MRAAGSMPYPAPVFRPGDRGEAVAEIRARLNELGMLEGPATPGEAEA